jgi:hypothetical protein
LREKMSLGPAAAGSDPLVPVSEAYEHTVLASRQPDAKVAGTSKAIRSSLAALDDKVRRVNLSFASCEETIFQLARDALGQLAKSRGEKVGALRAAEFELRRKLAEVERAERHLAGEAQRATEVDFLRVWKAHAEKRRTFHGERGDPKNGLEQELKAIAGVTVDIHVEGSLEVVSERAAGARRGPEDGGEEQGVRVYDGDELKSKHVKGLGRALGGSGGAGGGRGGGPGGPGRFAGVPDPKLSLSPAKERPHTVLKPTPPPKFGREEEKTWSGLEENMELAVKYQQYEQASERSGRAGDSGERSGRAGERAGGQANEAGGRASERSGRAKRAVEAGSLSERDERGFPRRRKRAAERASGEGAKKTRAAAVEAGSLSERDEGGSFGGGSGQLRSGVVGRAPPELLLPAICSEGVSLGGGSGLLRSGVVGRAPPELLLPAMLFCSEGVSLGCRSRLLRSGVVERGPPELILPR